MVHADDQYDPGLVPVMAQPILDGDADMVIGSRLLDDQAIAGGMPRWKWVGNRLLTRGGEQGLRRPVLGVPHRLPGVLGRPAPVDPVPAQLRSLRLRPGAVRPGHRARRAGRGDPDPDAVLPRGVERQLHDERALRPRDAGRPRPLHGGPARPELDAPAPPRSRLARAPGPVGETGCVSRRRLPRLGLAVWALLAVALVLRLGYVAATPDYAHRPRRARLRLPRALHSARRGLRPVLRAPYGVPTARLLVPARGGVRRRRRRPRGGRRARAAGAHRAGVRRDARRRADRGASLRSSGGAGRRSRRSRSARSTCRSSSSAARSCPSRCSWCSCSARWRPRSSCDDRGTSSAGPSWRASWPAWRSSRAPTGSSCCCRSRSARGTCGRAGRGARWRRRRCSSSSRSRPWRRGRSATPWSCTAFVPVSTQLGSALAGTYNDDARLDRENPASWRSLRRVDELPQHLRAGRDHPRG